jgi:hypothetical protein
MRSLGSALGCRRKPSWTTGGDLRRRAGTWAIQSIFWLIFFGSLGIVVLASGRTRKLGTPPATAFPLGETVAAVGVPR